MLRKLIKTKIVCIESSTDQPTLNVNYPYLEKRQFDGRAEKERSTMRYHIRHIRAHTCACMPTITVILKKRAVH